MKLSLREARQSHKEDIFIPVIVLFLYLRDCHASLAMTSKKCYRVIEHLQQERISRLSFPNGSEFGVDGGILVQSVVNIQVDMNSSGAHFHHGFMRFFYDL